MKQDLEDELAKILAEEIAKEIDQEVFLDMSWQMNIDNNPDWRLVQIKWTKEKDSSYMWNEVCAWAMEQFGLPGENYITHMSTDCINFLFRYEQDAILMTLKWI